jgi:pyruvate,water dikinase
MFQTSHLKSVKHKQIIGNKAEGIIFLKETGFNVPDFFVISFEELNNLISDELKFDSFLNSKLNSIKIEKKSLFAVRSSADAEDGKEQSFAGLFKTLINISAQNLKSAIKEVVQAYFEVQKLNYSNSVDLKFGIIVQEMLSPDYSGVMFSQNPININDKSAIINIVPGLGEELVSGRVEAFSIKKTKLKYKFINADENFSGKKFNENYIDINVNGEKIKSEVNTHLKNLFLSAKKISKLKKYPADIEFAIADNKIWFLQVRPITTLKNSEEEIISVWDNSNITENYPGISMPLTCSFVRYTYEKAYRKMSEFLGMNKKLIEKNKIYLSEMSGNINGVLYYNISSWQKLLYQMPFGSKTSKQITKILGMEPAEFQKPENKISIFGYFRLLGNLTVSFFNFNKLKKIYIDNFEKVMNEYENVDFKSKSYKELINIYYNLDKKLGDNWIAPMINGFFAMILFAALKKVVLKSAINKEYPNFANDVLFSSGDVISVKIVRDLQNILKNIGLNNELFQSFKNKNIDDIKSELLKSPEINLSIKNYIKKYGERSEIGELKIETVNYKENPDSFLEFLKNNVFEKTDKYSNIEQFDYLKVVKKNYRFKPIRKFLLIKLIKYTVARVKDRENFRFVRTKTFSLVRKIFRGIDQYLLKNKYIEEINDSLYLNLEEILNIETQNSYKEIITNRKAEYSNYNFERNANRYFKTKKGFTPVETIKEGNFSGKIKGTGCSSGIIKSEVIVIDEFSGQENNFEGKILVAKYFEPGKINYFSQASGLISERGNLLSHTAILSRELGIPAIVGAKGILSKIKTGDTVQMNGAKGEIIILNNNNEQI